ncbi:MAG: LamG-like jellyroll fold domain-containing protein [bacterium]|nr:LamG-like jellyroll fold domain-containing protein [bacterium]
MAITKNKFLITPVIFLLISIGFLNVQKTNADITTGLVGHWEFDEGSGTVATDSSGSGNTGTLTNGPTWVAGKVGSGAVRLDGTNDYVLLNNTVIGTQNLTFCAWVYQNSSPPNRFNSIIDNTQFNVTVDTYSAPTLNFRASNNGGASAISSSAYQTNTWNHVCFIRSGSTGTFYINGSISGTADQSIGTPTATGFPSAIGQYSSINATNFYGSMDEVRIYNRALSASDVVELYNYTGTPSDTEAPSIPTDLSATTVSSSEINLSWTASTDNVGVAGYSVFRCQGVGCTPSVEVATSATNSYSDSGLTASSTYAYTVAAYDAAVNVSSQSISASATTQAPAPDTTPPVRSAGAPSGTLATGTTGTTLSLTTDETANCRYSTIADTAYASMTDTFSTTGSTSHSTAVSGLSDGNTYNYYVRCEDSVGNPNTTDYTITFSVASPGTGNTINAASCSQTDVQNAINLAIDGDTVNIPEGTCPWTGTVTVNTAITVTGPTCTTDANGRATSCPTVITNNVSSGNVMTANLVYDKITRISNLEFASGTGGAQFMAINGANTDNRRFRVDHVKMMVTGSTFCAFSFGQAYGVVDHSTIAGNKPAYVGFIFGKNGSGSGDENFYAGPQWGTDKYVFFEDVTMDQTNPDFQLTLFESHAGGRYVLRNSTLNRGLFEVHGSDGSRHRSTVAIEVYNNVFTTSAIGSGIGFLRGGVQTIHDNAIYSPGGNNVSMDLLTSRIIDPVSSFGMADGRNQWDVNNPGNPFTTDTAVAAGVLTVDMSGAPWTNDQWKGYTVRKTGGPSVRTCSQLIRNGDIVTATCNSHGFSSGERVSVYGAALNTGNLSSYASIYPISNVTANTFSFTLHGGSGTPADVMSGEILATRGVWASVITQNDNNTLNFSGSLFGDYLTFSVGDTFEINKVDHSLDQNGRAGGSFITGEGGPTPPPGWNDQTTIGNYEWNNVRCPSSPPTLNCVGGSAAEVSFVAQHPQLQEGVHYFNDAQRAGYTPFIYPHPLVIGGGTPPPPAPDTTAPAISFASNITSSGATVIWGTNELATSQVEYGVTPSYGNQTVEDTVLKTNHSVILSGLSPITTYNFRIRTKDADGNLGLSSNYTFTTSAP